MSNILIFGMLLPKHLGNLVVKLSMLLKLSSHCFD